MGAGNRRIRGNIRECRHRASLLLEALLNRLGVAVGVEEVVGHDEHALAVPDFADLAERDGQTALLEIDLFRRAEPQHILSPNRNSLDVDKVHRTDVLGHRVAAPAAAAERERRGELEVVDVADAALRRRGVDEDSAGLHPSLELCKLILIVALLEVNRRCVAIAAIGNELLGLVEGVRKILRTVHRKNRRELFMSKRLGELDGLNLADENLRLFRNRKARDFRNRRGLLANNLRVDRPRLGKDDLADRIELRWLEEVAAAIRKLLLDRVVDLIIDDDALFRRANHAVVERLRVDNGRNRKLDVAGSVHNDWRVARTDAERRLAGAVGRLNHRRTASCENAVRLLHEHLRRGDGWLANAGDDILGGARLHRGIIDDHRGVVRALLGARMGADDDAVAGFQADERLENRRRSRVGSRDYRADETNRLGDLADAEGGVLFDDAAGLHVLVRVEDVLGRVVVLDDLVLDDAHARLGDRVLRERNAHVVRRQRRRTEDLVDLLLRVGRELLLRRAHLGDKFGELLRLLFSCSRLGRIIHNRSRRLLRDISLLLGRLSHDFLSFGWSRS